MIIRGVILWSWWNITTELGILVGHYVLNAGGNIVEWLVFGYNQPKLLKVEASDRRKSRKSPKMQILRDFENSQFSYVFDFLGVFYGFLTAKTTLNPFYSFMSPNSYSKYRYNIRKISKKWVKIHENQKIDKNDNQH